MDIRIDTHSFFLNKNNTIFFVFLAVKNRKPCLAGGMGLSLLSNGMCC